jgi:hypothetical protein
MESEAVQPSIKLCFNGVYVPDVPKSGPEMGWNKLTIRDKICLDYPIEWIASSVTA